MIELMIKKEVEDFLLYLDRKYTPLSVIYVEQIEIEEIIKNISKKYEESYSLNFEKYWFFQFVYNLFFIILSKDHNLYFHLDGSLELTKKKLI